MKNVDDLYSLTPVQQSMLAHALGGGDTGTLVEQLTCTIEGPLEVDRFERAWQATVARHDVLRTCFLWDGLKEPLQVVRSKVSLSCKVDDLRQLSSDDQTARYQGLRQADQHRGFDLTKAPLMRLQLMRMEDNRWRLLWTCHHLTLDGLSVPLVFRDAMVAYAAGGEGDVEASLPSSGQPRTKFRSYLNWLKKRDAKQSDQFWRETLAGYPQSSGLPMARPVQAFAVKQESKAASRCLPGDESKRLRDAAAAMKVSLNVVVQGAWAALLGRYLAETDVVYGVGMAGRPDDLRGASEMVGPMSTVVPLRVKASPEATCAEWLQKLHGTLADLQQHQYTRLEEIAEAAGLPPGRRPFDTMLVFENHAASAAEPLRIGEIAIREISGTASSGYQLTVVVVPGAELELRALYDPAVFDGDAVERMLDHLRTLLGEIAANPQARLSDLRLLSPLEREELAAEVEAGSNELIVDSAGQIAPIGVPGQLYIASVESSAHGARPHFHTSRKETAVVSNGPWAGSTLLDDEGLTMAGERSYSHRLTAASLLGTDSELEFVATNQRAVRFSDGTIERLGSVDAPLRVGLYGVDPAEVEAEIRKSRLVEDVTVIGQPDRQGETQLAAFLVPARDAKLAIAQETGSLVISKVRNDLEQVLAAPLVPRLWSVVEQIPRNDDGNVDVNALPGASQPRDPALGDYVPPRTEMEERLTAIWAEILGVEPIGVEDSFLELGGDSMSAMALMARLESDFESKLPLVSLFQRPTIAHLASLIENHSGESADNTMIPLRAEGEGTPLFCVHPAGGTVFCYLDFAKHLRSGSPVYGIQAQGLDGLQPPHDTLEAMATHYVQAMKAVQPQGPYQVCGWSSGGVLAFELACQLEAAGDEVSLLALFDAGIPRPGESFDEKDIVPMLGLMFPGESPEQIDALRQAEPEEQMNFFKERAEVAQILFAGSAGTQIQHVYHVFQANMAAVVAYQPRTFSGRVVLFRAEDQATPMHEDPQLGWGPWASQGVEVHEVPGSHLTMFQSPQVEQLIELLNPYLETAAKD